MKLSNVVGKPAAETSEWIFCQTSLMSSVSSANEYGRAVEVPEQLGAVGLGPQQVVELEAELVRQVADRVVTLVDELAAVLGDLPVGERAPDRPAAAADPVRRLVDLRRVPGLLQAVRARESRQPRPDDDDARACGRAGSRVSGGRGP